jgi:hypothetical protein
VPRFDTLIDIVRVLDLDLLLVPRSLVPAVQSLIRAQKDPGSAEKSLYAAELIDIREIRGLPTDVGALEGKALAMQRFDRGAKGEAVHMGDFAQVFGLYPEDKCHHRSFANIAAVLWAETGEPGTYEFFRRLVFSVLIGNADMHLKNWSLLYPDRRTAVFVARLRLRRHASLHSERQPSAQVRRQPQPE